jgi:glutaredoxin-like YruB-family protein
MSTKKVVVYGQPGCPPCGAAKAFLSEKGIAFDYKDVKSDFSALRELVGKYKSQTTPTIVVDEDVMIGFDPERLVKMLES